MYARKVLSKNERGIKSSWLALDLQSMTSGKKSFQSQNNFGKD